MRFFRKMAGFLGLSKDEEQVKEDKESVVVVDENRTQDHVPIRKGGGFSVPVRVPVEIPNAGPVLIPAVAGDGGVQGLNWYASRLRIDQEGDIADEFLDEVLVSPEMKTVSMTEGNKHGPFPRFEVKNSTLKAKVRKQVLTPQGKILHGVEHLGRLQWV